MKTTLFILLLTVAPACADPSSITGPAYVIDGDGRIPDVAV